MSTNNVQRSVGAIGPGSYDRDRTGASELLDLIYDRPPWMKDAACREHKLAQFFPPAGANKAVTAAKAVCAGCLVREECEEYAARFPDMLGVWGGRSSMDRKKGRPFSAAPVEAAADADPELVCPLCGAEAVGESVLALHLSRHHGLAGAGRAVKAERTRLIELARVGRTAA